MKFLREFETESAYNAEKDNLDLPNVSYVVESQNNYFHPYIPQRDYSREYLTYEVLEDGLLGLYFEKYGEAPDIVVSYSINDGEWSTLPIIDWEDTSSCIEVTEGDVIRFKGNNNAFNYFDDNTGDESHGYICLYDSTLSDSIEFNAYGNIMSVIYGDNFIGQTSFPNGSRDNLKMFFYYMGIVDASNLILPATTLTEGCYNMMFQYCTSLVNAPELPATTLVTNCYNYMFNECSSLSYIKCLATDISAEGCTAGWVSNVAASGIFEKAANMEDWTTGYDGIPEGWIIPEGGENLIVTTSSVTFYNDIQLVKEVGVGYFGSGGWSASTNVNWVTLSPSQSSNKVIQLTITASVNESGLDRTGVVIITDGTSSKTISLTQGEASYLTFEITSPGVIRWKCNEYGFSRAIQYRKNSGEWTWITSVSGESAPSISVTTGDKVKFKGDNSYYSEYIPIRSLRIFSCFSGTTAGFKLTGNIMSLISSTDFMALDHLHGNPEEEAFSYIFADCNTLIDASDLLLPAMSLGWGCYRNMFVNCSSLVNAPELPATTLVNSCYREMFNGCSSLSYIKCLATDISASNCTASWVDNVAASGTFVKASDMAGWTTGISGIPNGWTVETASQ